MVVENTVVDNKGQQQQQQGNENSNQDNKNSIINRVASFKPEEKPKGNEEVSFNPQDFEKIESVEEAKKYAESAYKSFERGFQKKFPDLRLIHCKDCQT